MNIKTQNCQPDLMEAFLRGDLDSAQEKQMTDHLETCDDCRTSLENSAAAPDGWLEASQLLKPTRFDWNRDAESGDLFNPIPLQIRNVLDSLAPSDDPEMLGQLGGYEVSGVVGAGAMGVVLKASDKSLDRTVAIKVLSPHLASSGAARKRFAREAKAAAAVLHPNVIAIHGVSNDQSLPHLVMPYVRGTSLQKRISDEGSLPINEVLRIGAQIAAGLAAANAQGLVHRDIKPANILLEEGVERVAITDFGLARAVDDASLTRTGIIAGTPQYMSPEQSRGESLDQRSDLFSLGSVMYAMCVGRPPFRSETTYGVIQRINNDQPTPIREINPDVPDWLAAIVMKLIAKSPNDRFESAAYAAELLESCLAHVQQPSSVPLPAAAIVKPNVSRTKKPPVFWGVIIASVAAAACFGFWAMFLWGGSDPPEIGGKWVGDRWGNVELKQTQPGQYEGTYGDGDSVGTIKLKWSHFEGRFNGTWGTGETTTGKLSLRLDDGMIQGASTNTSEALAPGTPRLAELQWHRPNVVEADELNGSRGRPENVAANNSDLQQAAELSSNQQTQQVDCSGVCVRNDDYRRIKDAIVRLFLYHKSDAKFVLAKTTTTDERGRFSFKGKVPAEFELGGVSRIAISSAGRATTIVPYQVAAENSQPIQLAPPTSITGRVTDEDSRPVEGANVIFGYLPGVWQVRTDSDGRFEIADVPSEERLRPKGLDIVMASHPKSDSLLTTATINSIPTSVNLKLTDVPNVPSYLARSAEQRLADAAQAIQGTWKANEMSEERGGNFLNPGLTFIFSGDKLRVEGRDSKLNLIVSEMDYRLLPDGKIDFVTGPKVFGSTISYMLMSDELWVGLQRDVGDGETLFDYSSLSRVGVADVEVAAPDDQSSALVILTDPAELENGNAMQQLAARTAMELLRKDDSLGLLNPAKDGEKWLWVGGQGLSAIGDKDPSFKNSLANSSLGDCQTFDPALQMALDGFASVKAKRKHMIIMTDGEPSLEDKALLKKFHDAGIKISVALSAAHGRKHEAKMKQFSRATGGKLWYVSRTRKRVLEQILQREVRRIARPRVVGD